MVLGLEELEDELISQTGRADRIDWLDTYLVS